MSIPIPARIETLAQLEALPQGELIDAISAGLPAPLARSLARLSKSNSIFQS